MDKKEVEELDQNFDFKSYPDLWVYCDDYKEELSIFQNIGPFNFNFTFFTQNLDLDYEIIQIFVNYFLKLFKIYKLEKGGVIDLNRYNYKEFQNLIDQYYFEMFGEENKLIQSGFSFSNCSRFETNNLRIEIKLLISEIQLEEMIKLLRGYDQWIEKKLKN